MFILSESILTERGKKYHSSLKEAELNNVLGYEMMKERCKNDVVSYLSACNTT
jgi:hypothetical protein